MGQCFSSSVGGATEEAYRARWEGGGLASGISAFEHNKKYETQIPGQVPSYATTANVGMNRVAERPVQDHEKLLPQGNLEPIAEDHSLQLEAASPQKVAAGGIIAPSNSSAQGVPNSAQRQKASRTRNWTRGELIGQGAFGSVYLGMDNETGQLMAVKQVSIGRQNGAGGGTAAAKFAEHLKSLEAEVLLLRDLHHPNIVCYLGTDRSSEALNIFLEYVPGGSIASLVAKFGSFSESVVRLYTKQILLGLEYLHVNGIIHRDIKGANILVDNTGLVKLADFGASKKIEDLVTIESGFKSVKGTPYWMAPEVITQSGHGRQADIWSVACTVIEMATGKPPWSQYGSQVSAMFHIAKSKGPPTIPEHLSPDCKDFLYLCFNRNWKERPSAAKLLQHPFLIDVVCRTSGAQPPINAALPVIGPAFPDASQPSPRQPQQQQQQQVENASDRKEPPLAAPAVSSCGSPAKQPSIAPNENPAMSPLGNNLVQSRGDGVSGGTRRQLALEGTSQAGNAPPSARSAGVRYTNDLPASKRPAVAVSMPAFSLRESARDVSGESIRQQKRSRAQEHSRDNVPEASVVGAQSKPLSNVAIDADEKPSVIPDSATQGVLHRSGSMSRSKRTLLNAAASIASGGVFQPVPRNDGANQSYQEAAEADPLSVPSTVDLSTGVSMPRDATIPFPSAASSLSSGQEPTILLRHPTVAIESSSRSSGSGSAFMANSTHSKKKGNQVASSLSSGSTSQRSEFNPMEEPAWAQEDSPSDEATSVTGFPAVVAQDKLQKTMNLNAKPPLHPRTMSTSLEASRRSSEAGAISRRSSGAVSSSNGSRSEGPIVYTIAADVGYGGVEVLPWDADPTNAGSGDLGGITAGGWSAREPRRKEERKRGAVHLEKSTMGRDNAAQGNGAKLVTKGRESQGDAAITKKIHPADHDALIRLSQQRAAQDLRASMAVFSQANGTARSDLSTSDSSACSGCGREDQMTAQKHGGTVVGPQGKVDLIDDLGEVTSPVKTTRRSLNGMMAPPQGAVRPGQSRLPRLEAGALGESNDAGLMHKERENPMVSKMVLPPSLGPSPSASPTKIAAFTASGAATGVAWDSPSRRRLTMPAGSGGSYEQQLRMQREGRGAAAASSGYAARAALMQATPSKSMVATPLRTPRSKFSNVYADRRPGSAAAGTGQTPARRDVARALDI